MDEDNMGASASRPGSREPSRKGVLYRIEAVLASPALSMALFGLAIVMLSESLIAAAALCIVFANYSVRLEQVHAALLKRDSDGSPEGRDAQRLDGEAATARAAEGGIAREDTP